MTSERTLLWHIEPMEGGEGKGLLRRLVVDTDGGMS